MLQKNLLIKVSAYDKKVCRQQGHTVFQCCENFTFLNYLLQHSSGRLWRPCCTLTGVSMKVLCKSAFLHSLFPTGNMIENIQLVFPNMTESKNFRGIGSCLCVHQKKREWKERRKIWPFTLFESI